MGTYDSTSGSPRYDTMFDSGYVCEICGRHIDECECIECPICGVIGCIECCTIERD